MTVQQVTTYKNLFLELKSMFPNEETEISHSVKSPNLIQIECKGYLNIDLLKIKRVVELFDLSLITFECLKYNKGLLLTLIVK